MRAILPVLILLAVTVSLEGRHHHHNKLRLKHKRQEVPKAVTTAPAPNIVASDSSTNEQKLVCYLDFEGNSEVGTSIKDKSQFGNSGYREKGLLLVNFQGCGNAAYLYSGDIVFHGDTFQGKPDRAITIAAWVRLLELPGSHSIFDTVGSSHECGQYHFEINDGNVRWFHRNETQNTVFSVETTGGLVKQAEWVHIVGTYDGTIGKAKIYVNGDLKNMSVNEYGGYLSRDWNIRVGIGDHKNFRPVLGFVDEFRIYNYAIKKQEILDIFNKCQFQPAAGTGGAPAVGGPVAPGSPVGGAPAAPAAPVSAPAAPGAPVLAQDAVLINDDKPKEKEIKTPDTMEETILRKSTITKPKKHWD